MPSAAARSAPARGALLSGLVTAALVGALLLAATIVVLGALGCRVVVIKSGSMTPGLPVGALVLSRSAQPSEIRTGDVVTFHSSAVGGDLVTHRVVSMSAHADVVSFETKGDANTVSESWSIGARDRVGRAVGHVPYLGWWFAILQTGAGRVAMIALACVWVALVAVPRIWANA